MRAFIVFCLVASASADKLGYNYRPVGHSNVGLSFTPGGSVGHVSSGFNGGFGHSGNGGAGFGASVGGFGVDSSSLNSGSNFGVSSNGGVSYSPQVELEKEFYTFTANENDFATPHVENQFASSGRKGLRVIFIKGPEHNGLENAAVALAKQIAEQKTAIYVLQKQTDLGSLSQKLNTISSNVNHKPEVHFVKYRTHEDAINAQKAIQGQYDALGGVSNSFNGGEAPVLNFASKAPVAIGSAGSSGSHGSFGSSGAVDSFISSGSLGSVGSIGSSGTIDSSGSLGSSELPSSSVFNNPPSAPSSTYLPA